MQKYYRPQSYGVAPSFAPSFVPSFAPGLTLNYLGFTTRKLGDFETAEKYYLEGLALKPNHIGINEYLGELYVATNRHNLAVERLEVLKSCSCEEYDELKSIIAGEKVSKY